MTIQAQGEEQTCLAELQQGLQRVPLSFQAGYMSVVRLGRRHHSCLVARRQ